MTQVLDPATHAPSRGSAPLWAGIGLSLAAPVLTWWAIGPLGTGWPDHEVGPYHAPLTLESLLGWVALLLAGGCAAAWILPVARRASRRAMSPLTALCLMAAGASGAAGWRVVTAGSDGANIGAGALLLCGPLVVAGLVVVAVRVEVSHRGTALRLSKTLTLLAVLIAPLLYAVEYGVNRYDQSRGIITEGQYAAVQVGDPHDAVRHALGRPAEPTAWFFTPNPTGSTCDYYDQSASGGRVYRICYRNDVVITTQHSDHPANPAAR